MTRRYFGTDGVRGRVGKAPITPDFVLRLGQAAGRVLRRQSLTGHATVLIGKDTRVSGYMLCLLYTSPSPRDISGSRMPSSA